MIKSLFRKKRLDTSVDANNDEGNHSLHKVLNVRDITALGIAAIIGAGIFSTIGTASADGGPGVIFLFLFTALACSFAAFCYADFASRFPVAGSAYTYAYVSFGELIAWIIGWDLVLEYAVGAATVASSWSGYFGKLLSNYGLAFPDYLIKTPFDGGIMNLPAVFIVVLMSSILIRGTSESAWVNNIIVILKVSIVLIFIIIGFKYIRPENLTPLIPENKGSFGEFGWTGIIRAAAVVFFAYIGFDAVSTAAQETKDPKKSMPIGIMGSLVICTVLYILFAYVMTGVVNYTKFSGQELAPVATAIEWMGPIVNGVPQPDYPWLNTLIILAILLGYSSVILVMLLGQSRVFYSMSVDGLLPRVFSDLHPKYKSPYKGNLVILILVGLFAAFVPGDVVGHMTSIGTLFAFMLVCLAVIILRKKEPNLKRQFKTPLVPFIPILGILACGLMIFGLGWQNWARLGGWLAIGMLIYYAYGRKHSKLKDTE